MQLLHSLTKYVTIFFIMLVILCLILGAIAYYLLKIKKIASKEERFDYSRFDRKDSIDYVRFDQIINTTENGIQTKNGLIVLNDGYRYIAGLKVSGFNFFSASAQEQHQSMSGMIAFLNAIEGDIQYRQSTKAIDLTENIEKHKKRLKEVEMEIYSMRMDHEELCEKAESYINQPEIYANYDQKMNELERAIKSKEHTQAELDIVIQYMNALSGTNLEAEKVQCWLFDWNYNSNDYTEELSDEEKYAKAASALSTKSNSYIAALQRTGCTCERMSAEEILELFRYHFAPITADSYKIADLYDSSVNALYITSDSLDTLKRDEEEERMYFDTINEKRMMQEELEKRKELENTLIMSDATPSQQNLDTADTFDVQETFAPESLSQDELGISENEDLSDDFAVDFDMENDVPFTLGDLPPVAQSLPADVDKQVVAPVKKEKKKKNRQKTETLDGQQTILDSMPFGNSI